MSYIGRSVKKQNSICRQKVTTKHLKGAGVESFLIYWRPKSVRSNLRSQYQVRYAQFFKPTTISKETQSKTKKNREEQRKTKKQQRKIMKTSETKKRNAGKQLRQLRKPKKAKQTQQNHQKAKKKQKTISKTIEKKKKWVKNELVHMVTC